MQGPLCMCTAGAGPGTQPRVPAPYSLPLPYPHPPTHAVPPHHWLPPLQLLAAAGMDKGALEEELAVREEQHLVAEFRRNLEYNLGKVGGTAGRYCGMVLRDGTA